MGLHLKKRQDEAAPISQESDIELGDDPLELARRLDEIERSQASDAVKVLRMEALSAAVRAEQARQEARAAVIRARAIERAEFSAESRARAIERAEESAATRTALVERSLAWPAELQEELRRIQESISTLRRTDAEAG